MNRRSDRLSGFLRGSFIITVLLFILSCDIDFSSLYSFDYKIYPGNYGYDVIFRVKDNEVYSGNSGYNVVYRIEDDKIYSGNSGYNVIYKIDIEMKNGRINGKIYSNDYRHDIIYRIDDNKVYSKNGYEVLYRIEKY